MRCPDLGGLVGDNVFDESAGRLMMVVSRGRLLSKGGFLLIVRRNGSTQGLRLGVNPDSHPWADAAHGGPEAR